MDEYALRELIREVRSGRLSRRGFVETMIGLGLTTPLAAQMLASVGVARAQPRAAAFTPTRRGGGGLLRRLMVFAPTLLNPRLAVAVKDWDASRIFYEPLASFDADGALVPILAREIPTVDNGGVAKDGLSVIWRLKPGVLWHDGQPFTASDVVFNWEYTADPATGSPASGIFQDLERVEALDAHTVRVVFKRPTPFWPYFFCGYGGIVPKHHFAAFRGARAREAPANLKPVGTGPYRIVDFKPGDLIRAELNPTYHVPNRPFFDTLEVKGGGDFVSAARAVLQTGDYDIAGVLVDDEVLKRLEAGGKGRVVFVRGGAVDHVQVNQTDPWTEVDGERSSVKTTHPLLTDPAVRAALPLLIDRAAIQEHVYGRQGRVTANMVNAPERFVSPNMRWEFSVEKASQVLEAGAWRRGPDGVRVKDGKRLRLLFQTQASATYQKVQAIVKQACARAGVEIELKAVAGSSFYSSDPANPDTYTHFYADLQMLIYPMTTPDPGRLLSLFTSREAASKANQWQRVNAPRWRSDEYDRTVEAAQIELDPVKRAALLIRCNDVLVQGGAVIPVVSMISAGVVANTLKGVELSGWDLATWRLAYWYREA
jgi:peptide/nickel transport system substrate-binding protein